MEPTINEENVSSPVVEPAMTNAGNTVAPVTQEQKTTVEVPKEVFDSMLERLNKLEAEQKLILAVEDKNKIRKIEELRNAGKLVKSVKLNIIENKVVVAYRILKDEVYLDTNGRLIENQTLEAIFDDGSTKEIAIRQWAAFTSYVDAEVIKESRESDGEMFYTVKTSDGKEVIINVRFVN